MTHPVLKFAVVLFASFILGCGDGKEEAGKPASEIRIGNFPNITHGQAVYARATGDYEKKIGMPVRWTSFNAGPTAIEALFSEAIDATYIGPNPAINGHMKSRGEHFVIVTGAASGGAGLVVRKDAGITGDKDFSGKIVATPQLGNTQDVAAKVWFSERGYRLKESGGNLTIMPLANPDQLTLFQKKDIHAAWTVEPWVSRLEIEGGGELLLDEKTLWPEGRYVTTHLIVRKEFLKNNREAVKKLVAAHVETTEKINADKKAAAKIINEELKNETGKALPEEVINRAMQRVEFTWDPIAASLRKSADAAHKIGFIRDKPNLEGIYDLSILNEVLREKNLAEVAQ
ncbi:MAG: ABC transporter substrate-binding protein [Burkholderiales bacterium]